MTDLIQTMSIFNPSHETVIVDIEIEATTDRIKADLITNGGKKIRTIHIKHNEFEKFLDENGYFERETVHDYSNHEGKHIQTVYADIIDYPVYLKTYLCAEDVYDFLKAWGKTSLKFDRTQA